MQILLLLLIRVLNSSLTSCAYAGHTEGWCAISYYCGSGARKRLLRALEDNIAKYERVFGPIRTSDEPPISPLTGVKGEA